MNLLQIVQRMHYEAKLPGTPPSTAVGQSGRAADLVRWAIEAYNDIQREQGGRWKWLRRDFTVDTAADKAVYSFDECTDVADGAPISRFRAWHFDTDELPLIYRVSDGKSTEGELAIAEWEPFRRNYVRGTHASATPRFVTTDPAGKLRLGPTPDDVYRVSGSYWAANQILANDADEPEMPEDFQMLIVYRGLESYGYDVVAQEILARVATEGGRLWESLLADQSYGRFSMSLEGPLA